MNLLAIPPVLSPTGEVTIPEIFNADQEQQIKKWQYHLGLRTMLQAYDPADDSPEELALAGKTRLEVMWLRVAARATNKKLDMRAVEFVQEHKFGKAVQRTEVKAVHMTYQDLLQKVSAAEDRFQETVGSVTITDAMVQEVRATTAQSPLSWSDLL